MPVVELTNFPTVATVTNLVRSDIRDDMAGATNTIGEGQILVDNLGISVTMANFFNSALRELCRQLRIQQAPMLIGDNYIISNIPPMNGPQGLQVADPSVQCAIGPNGYYDGTLWHGNYPLPQGVYQVIRCWERQTGSNDVFQDMGEPSNGMAGVYQGQGWGRWEWRNGMVWVPGSLDNRDLRVRWLMLLNALFVPNVNIAQTYIPIMDCEEALARKIDRMYAYRQGGTMYQMAVAESTRADRMFLNEEVKKQQGQEYTPQIYGNEGPPILAYGQG